MTENTTLTATDLCTGLIEQAKADIALCEKAIDTYANYSNVQRSTDFMKVAEGLAGAEASMKIHRTIASAARFFAENDYDLAAVRLGLMSELVSMATEGADDTWSGRGNDLARSANDAKLKTISMIQSRLNR